MLYNKQIVLDEKLSLLRQRQDNMAKDNNFKNIERNKIIFFFNYNINTTDIEFSKDKRSIFPQPVKTSMQRRIVESHLKYFNKNLNNLKKFIQLVLVKKLNKYNHIVVKLVMYLCNYH